MRMSRVPAQVFIASSIAKLRTWTWAEGVTDEQVFDSADVRTEMVLGWKEVPVEGRTRSFTKHAAYMALARAFCRVHCECEEGDSEVGASGYTCRLHAMSYEEVALIDGRTVHGYGEKIRARLTRYLWWLDKREAELRALVRMEVDDG